MFRYVQYDHTIMIERKPWIQTTGCKKCINPNNIFFSKYRINRVWLTFQIIIVKSKFSCYFQHVFKKRALVQQTEVGVTALSSSELIGTKLMDIQGEFVMLPTDIALNSKKKKKTNKSFISIKVSVLKYQLWCILIIWRAIRKTIWYIHLTVLNSIGEDIGFSYIAANCTWKKKPKMNKVVPILITWSKYCHMVWGWLSKRPLNYIWEADKNFMSFGRRALLKLLVAGDAALLSVQEKNKELKVKRIWSC